MPMNIGPMEILVLLVVVIIIAGAVAVVLRLGIKRPAAASDTPPPAASAADELGKLDALHQRGVLTDDEFESQKRALLVADRCDDARRGRRLRSRGGRRS